jgi:predicted Zn-dependent peptidase
MKIETFLLPNGIRLVHKNIPGDVAHCGVFIDAGSRDESPEEHGIAHFIEHLIFKGTQKRNFYQVLNRLENVGADLNAYTTKEDTCIHASFLNPYYERTLELMSDICFHSIFPAEEMKKEKAVVIDEIKSYEDTPAEQIFDDFEDQVFHGHPLGRNILGTPRNIRTFRKEHIFQFVRRNYTTDKIVISSVGNVEMKKLIHWVLKYFSEIPASPGKKKRFPFKGYQPQQIVRRRKNFQTHCIIGAPGFSLRDDRRFPLAFLTNILGGPMMNSRLAMALKEKNGITYNIEAGYVAFSDTGIFTIYFGTSGDMLGKAIELTHKELDKLKHQRLGPVQLETAKKVILGQMALTQESQLNQMLAIGKSFLVMNRFMDFDEISRIVSGLTAKQVQETANEIFCRDSLSSLVFKS